MPPKFVDDPEQREKRLREAIKAQDIYGNNLYKIGAYWCSFNHKRLCQLVKEVLERDDHVIVVRISDGRYFSKQVDSLRRSLLGWKKRLDTRWYAYVDPISQQVY
jgi:hypothetical protein